MVIELAPSKNTPIILPTQYNHLVQAALYRSISPELSEFLHEKGLLYKNRSFKLFTFSRLFGKISCQNNQFFFTSPIRFYVGSPLPRFIRELANNLLSRGQVTIGNIICKVRQISFPKEPLITSLLRIKMLSPVTVYSTLHTHNGRKKTYYYNPQEDEFAKQIDANLKRKALILTSREFKSSLSIKPDGIIQEAVLVFKGTIIKGWMGRFTVKGPKTLLRLGYEAGLGSKNPQGFGMFEVCT